MINMNDILMFENIHGYTENGNTFFLIDDIVRELGFTAIKKYSDRPIENMGTTNGSQNNYYTNELIRWQRINDYLAQYNLPPVSRGQYVHEDIAVYLAIKANNEKAKAFHHKLVKIIIPYFRDNVTKEEYNRLVQERDMLKNYYNTYMVLDSNLINTTIIAKDFGLSAQALHKLLESFGILYKTNGTYAINQSLANYGFTRYKNEINGKINLYWTEFGRMFIYGLLTKYGLEIGKDNTQIVNQIINSKNVVTELPIIAQF